MPKAGETTRNTAGRASTETTRGGTAGVGATATDWNAETGETGGGFTDNLRNLRERAGDYTGRARQYMSGAYSNVHSTIAENPGSTAAVTFGVGALIGALITFLIMNQTSDYESYRV